MKGVDIIYRYGAGDLPPRPRPTDPAAAKFRLDEGNRAFAELLGRFPTDQTGQTQWVIPVDVADLGLSRRDGKGPAQNPFAAVLGCSDARVPIELIFNEGPNDLFVVRVAGNGIGSEGLGSLKYATEHLGDSLRLLTVLGHSGCGAVSAAVDLFLNPSQYLHLTADQALRDILDRLLVVVHVSARRLEAVHGAGVVRLPGYREALIEAAVAGNAALAAYMLQREFAGANPSKISAVFGVYVLGTRRIWAPRAAGGEWTGLADPPADAAAFAAFGNAIMESDRIVGLLRGG